MVEMLVNGLDFMVRLGLSYVFIQPNFYNCTSQISLYELSRLLTKPGCLNFAPSLNIKMSIN